MTLIVCVECGKEFSDKAEACPNCGCPTEDILQELKEKAFKDSIYKDVAEESSKESESKDECITEVFEIPTYNNSSEFDKKMEALKNKKTEFTQKKKELVSKFDKLSKEKLQDRRPKSMSPVNMKKAAIICIISMLLLVCLIEMTKYLF